MVPYTYLLKHKPTDTYYYGCRYSKNCDPSDLWVKYFTSSKYVKNLIQEFGEDSFEYEVRKTFKDANSARNWENKILRRMKVITRSDFINRTDNISISTESCSIGGKTAKKWGIKKPQLSLRNSKMIGEKNHMFGKRNELAPRYGIKGDKHPMFGKKNKGVSESYKKVVTCPHCSKIGQKAGMQRWHFNFCKNKGV
jgi:hypothetical protein